MLLHSDGEGCVTVLLGFNGYRTGHCRLAGVYAEGGFMVQWSIGCSYLVCIEAYRPRRRFAYVGSSKFRRTSSNRLHTASD